MEFTATMGKRWFRKCVGKGACCMIEFKRNRYNSVKHNHVFHSGITSRFGLQTCIIRSPLQNYKVRCNTVQIMQIRGGVTAFCPGAFAHCLPFIFSDSDYSVRSTCPSLVLSQLQAVHKTLSICGSWLNSKQSFISFPEFSISYKLSLSISLVPFHVKNTSVRLSPTIRKETVCWIFMKVGIGVLYKKLSRMHDFRENLSTDSHFLLKIVK
jgi:hypothetical protein